MNKKIGCPVGYFKTKEGRCVNITVKPLVSDKGVDYGIWLKILTESNTAYDYQDNWGLYKDKETAQEMAISLRRDMKTKGIPEMLKKHMEM